ncbi:MAG: hypothetical protein EOL89_00040 [Actinobacteria bacterium]|nr:hypothetical protein [Actinomycetota bacterium]
MIAGAAVLTVALVAGWALTRDQPGQPVAAPFGSTGTEGTTPASGAGATAAQSPETFPDVVVPPGSKECGRFGSGPLAAVGTANETTSCPFSLNVHTEYLASGLDGTPGQVTAWSPVTEKWYTLDCSGSQPVLCTGGVAARVILYGGSLVISADAAEW